MTDKPSLSALYRHATAARDSGIGAEDVARLAAGEHLGARHDAAVEALAGSAPALAAFRAARAVAPVADAIAAGDRVVVAFPRQRQDLPRFAMAAGVMAMALSAGLLWRMTPDGAGPAGPAVALDDRIFSVSYESDTAIAADLGAPRDEEAIFVDEFGG
jgi:hypothetical protein